MFYSSLVFACSTEVPFRGSSFENKDSSKSISMIGRFFSPYDFSLGVCGFVLGLYFVIPAIIFNPMHLTFLFSLCFYCTQWRNLNWTSRTSLTDLVFIFFWDHVQVHWYASYVWSGKNSLREIANIRILYQFGNLTGYRWTTPAWYDLMKENLLTLAKVTGTGTASTGTQSENNAIGRAKKRYSR